MAITSTSISHVRLTVTDIERSRRFYESVFGWPVLLEVPDNADEATRAHLDAAAAHLDELGIRHELVQDIGPSYILEFRDPDNIALELTAPK